MLVANSLTHYSLKGKASKKPRYVTVRLTVRVPPPLYGQLSVKFFFVCFFILAYDSMCSEMDFTPCSSNYKNSQLLLTAAAAPSQNGQITA